MGRRLIGPVVAIVACALLVALGGSFYFYREVTRAGPLTAEAVLVIPTGSGGRQIGQLLVDAGVITNSNVFVVAARLRASDGPLHAGEFAFPARVSVLGAIGVLQSGKTVVHSLTVAEGLTTVQVLAVLEDANAVVGDAPARPEEGMLLPETYHYSRGDTREQIVARMEQAMADAVAELWQRRDVGLPFDEPDQAVTLASIVEKETAVDGERPRIAGVFVNRLRRGMRLQSDPTVVYALTGGQGPLGRELLRADLDIEHPYNTYFITGLPPGPIANPGRASLEAVLQPLETDELYFVADGNGGHAFAETFEEHQRNVARWRRLQRE